MSSITSGVGVFSGINSSSLIDQLLALEGKQKTVYQRRIVQLQQQQASYLDLNSKLSALKTAAAKFNSGNIFGSAAASTSDDKVLTAVAAPGASAGSYQFIVDRLVSTQQLLSQGFAASTGSGIGLTKLTLESTQARLDRDTSLSSLNGGLGVQRGKIQVTDASGATATIDLSRAETVNEVLSAINTGTSGRVRAKVDGDRLVVENVAAGSGTLTIANVDGTTASSLGIAGAAGVAGAGGVLNGQAINRLGERTALAGLNDGLGVQISNAAGTATPDFTITTRANETLNIDIGDMYADVIPPGGTTPILTKVKSAVSDLGGVIQRINEQGVVGGIQKVRAQLKADGTGIEIIDLTGGTGNLVVANTAGRATATDLGIEGSIAGGTLSGKRIQAGLNSTLVKTLLGGKALQGAGSLDVETSDGVIYNVNLNSLSTGSITDLMEAIRAGTDGKVSVALDKNGTGLTFTDTAGGPGALQFSGVGADTLGITNTDGDNVAQSKNLQHQYIGVNTKLSALNNGRGIPVGSFDLINSYGKRFTINVTKGTETVADLLSNINSAENITARINDTGDGILIEAKVEGGVPGGQKVQVIERSGNVAKSLNLLGTSASANAGENKIDGSYERQIAFGATDSLTDIVAKINQSGADVTASVINDANPTRPFRLSLASKTSGLSGAFLVSSEGADFGFTSISQAQNSRVFFGSSDPAQALLFSSSSNSITGVAQNLTVNLKAVSSSPVTVSIAKDADAIQKSVEEFVTAFNALVDKIDAQSKYDVDAKKGGILLGDSLAQNIRGSIFSTVTGKALGVSGRYQFAAEVGLTVDKGGDLKLDSAKLRQALETDPQAVADLLSAKTSVASAQTEDVPGLPGIKVRVTGTTTFTAQGVFERLVSTVDRYVDPINGLLTRGNKSITDQITAQNTRISTIDAALERKRTRLQTQFTAMESAIGKLQGQQGAIANIKAITF